MYLNLKNILTQFNVHITQKFSTLLTMFSPTPPPPSSKSNTISFQNTQGNNNSKQEQIVYGHCIQLCKNIAIFKICFLSMFTLTPNVKDFSQKLFGAFIPWCNYFEVSSKEI